MKRLWILGLCLVIAFSSVQMGVEASNSEIKKTENELNRVHDLLNDVNTDRKTNEAKQGEVVRKIGSLESEIDKLENDIDTIDGNIQNTEQEIGVKEQEISVAQTVIDSKKETLNKRLRVMYKTGSVGYLEVLLGASDFEDLLTRIDAVKMIFLHDTRLIEEQIQQRDIIKQRREDLVVYKEELSTLRQEKSRKQVNLDAQKGELGTYKAKLVADHKVLEKQLDQLNEDAEKIKKILANLKLAETYVGGVMTWPAPGYTTITSPFGYRMHPILKKKKLHTGVDIGVPSGTTVVAAQTGTVIHADWLGGYGKVVMLDHGGGIVTLYAHNSKLLVKVGDKVVKGQAITKSGSTGQSTGPHLHFEVRVNGEYVDPITYVTKQ